MYKNQKIFLTGGTGFVGGYILKDLIRQGYSDITALKRETSDMSMMQDIRNQINWVTGDLLSLDVLYDAAAQSDVIMLCAALVSFEPEDKIALYEVNSLGTEYLVTAALNGGVKHFIHISSVGALAKPPGG